MTEIAEDGQAEARAIAMARALLERSLSSFAWSKRLLSESFETAFEVQLERERTAIATCAALPDGQEGLRAFVEKRRPIFGRPAAP